MKISIEGLIIKWAHQVVHTTSQRNLCQLSGGRSALKRISGRPLEWTQSRPDDWTELLERKVFFQRLNIGKLFNAQCRRINLESLFEQMSSPTSIKMASILNVLNSAYYPCFRLEPFIFLPQELLSGRCFDTWLLQWQKPKTYQFIFVLWNLISRLTLKIRCQFFNLNHLSSGVGRCRIFWALSNLLPDAARHLPHLLHQRALQLPGKNHRSGAGKDRWQQQQICFSNWSLQEICNLLIDHACRYINPPTIFTIEVKYHRVPYKPTAGWRGARQNQGSGENSPGVQIMLPGAVIPYLAWIFLSKGVQEEMPLLLQEESKKMEFQRRSDFPSTQRLSRSLEHCAGLLQYNKPISLAQEGLEFSFKITYFWELECIVAGNQSKFHVIRANFVLQCKILSDEGLERPFRPFRCLDARQRWCAPVYFFHQLLQCIGTFFPPTFAKVEIGGLRGKVLTMNVDEIYHQFTEFYGIFGKR